MSYLEVGGRRYPIPVGEAPIGRNAAGEFAVGTEVSSSSAILQGLSDGQVAIRRTDPNADILINGIHLGPQPTPLLHGDKLEMAGQELLFVDDRRAGTTSFIQAVNPEELRAAFQPTAAAGAKATVGTGGRLVSLMDGREYVIEGGSLLIGREAGCDVVVTSKNVSRRHAEIVATPKGYLLIDSSTNGTFVNGERVPGQRLLSRSDVIRCGEEEFRFYADVREEARPQAPAGSEQRLADTMLGVPAAPRPSPEPPSAPAPPAGAEHRLADTLHGLPNAAPGEPPPSPAGTPAGAEKRLADTLLGIPGVSKPRPPVEPEPQAAGPAPGAEQRLAKTMHGIPVAKRPPRPAQPPGQDVPPPPQGIGVQAPSPETFAVFVVRTGPLKGQRLPVRLPVVSIGRADYNDIVLPDDSVSTVHAKLQRREGVWVLVDEASTNGTVVDGVRVTGETALAPGAIVRFGSVQTIFEPTDDAAGIQKGGATRVIQAVNIPPPADPRRSGPSPAES